MAKLRFLLLLQTLHYERIALKLVFKRRNCYKVSIKKTQSVLKMLVLVVVQLREYAKNNWIIHFKWVNFMICEL